MDVVVVDDDVVVVVAVVVETGYDKAKKMLNENSGCWILKREIRVLNKEKIEQNPLTVYEKRENSPHVHLDCHRRFGTIRYGLVQFIDTVRYNGNKAS